MARKEDAERLLKEGHCPAEIAGKMGISVSSVIQYLCTRVGEGSLRLSDIYFSWPPEKRVDGEGLTIEENKLFKALRRRGVFSGDMYDFVTEAEIAIHTIVRTILEREFGTEESGWWRKGIPSSIREKCASRREQDDEPCDSPFAYTTLIDLSTIITKSWPQFQKIIPTEYAANRKQLENDLIRLNGIRNAVMHPVKERKWTEDDFEFVRSVSHQFKAICPS